jgi:mannose-6-phosphate isomerase-like protein (cupin superfamily)
MQHTKRSEAPSFSRQDGLVSKVLHPTDEDLDTDLTVTWVEVEPGASQVRHSHDPEQVYVVVAGEGVMSVGEDSSAVEAGDAIYIPSNAEHEITNTGEEPLEYVSVATPAFPTEDVEEFYEE